MENSNEFPVRIQHVTIGYNYDTHHGEVTQSIFVLEPLEKKNFSQLSHTDGFYVYSMEGVLIGWLRIESIKQ